MPEASVQLTRRDLDVFAALERGPFTVRQLRALSETFPARFRSDRRLQDRLAQLAHAGLLHRFRYAALEGTGQYYYTLSPESFRVLHGPAAPLPSPGLFRAIGLARQPHTKSLADFLVHTLIGAHRLGLELVDFHRENTLRLACGDDSLYPDCALTLRPASRTDLTFFVELDNSTEPLASPRERECWLKKLRFYEALQDRSDFRFRVLGLVTKSPQRLQNLLSLAASQAKNPKRSLFYAAYLPDYLAHPSPLEAPLFVSHLGLRVSLVPQPSLPVPLSAREESPAMAKTLAD